MADKKEAYIVGGPNGSGKTTFVKQFLPNYVKVRNFVNADDIVANGVSGIIISKRSMAGIFLIIQQGPRN